MGYFGSLLVSLQDLAGIHRDTAWMNYASLITAGGAVGPFLSQIAIQWISRKGHTPKVVKDHEELTRVRGLQFSLRLQLVTQVLLLIALATAESNDVAVYDTFCLL